MNTFERKCFQAIRDAYPVPPHVAREASAATYDLYHGPEASTDDSDDTDGWRYTGFAHACAVVRDWLESSVPSTLYYEDELDYVAEDAPEPYLDEDTGEWYDTESYCEVSYTDIKRALFGALADYL